jgi:hypothetical protein
MKSNRQSGRWAASGVLLVLVAVAFPLRAQNSEVPDSVRHRNNCRLAGQVLHTGHSHPKYEWARDYVILCQEEGPAMLASEWEAIPADTAQVNRLQRESARFRDVRLYRELRETALDRSRPDLVRVGAMLALAKYVDPHSASWFSDLRPPPGEIRRIPLVVSHSTAGVWDYGSEPLGPVAQPVLELLERIAAQQSIESREIWYAAAVLARRVRWDIEAGRAR